MKIDFILTNKVQIFKIVEIPNSINTAGVTGWHEEHKVTY